MNSVTEFQDQFKIGSANWNKLVCDFMEASARGENPDRAVYLALLSGKAAHDKFVALTNASLLLLIAHRAEGMNAPRSKTSFPRAPKVSLAS